MPAVPNTSMPVYRSSARMWIRPPASPAMMVQSFARVQHCADASQAIVAIVEPFSSPHLHRLVSGGRDGESAVKAGRRFKRSSSGDVSNSL
jgi:hypothetical protein